MELLSCPQRTARYNGSLEVRLAIRAWRTEQWTQRFKNVVVKDEEVNSERD